MDAIEAGKLLVILGAVTGREPSAAAAQGWAWALDDLPFEIGEQALRQALKASDGSSTYVTPTTLRRYAAPMMRRLATDVRSAKLRGWVQPDYPETSPLPREVSERLVAEWTATNDAAELASGAPAPREIER